MPRVIFLLFLLAVLVRFLYFPNNVNFAYDQARDSFAALDILKGDFKIIGPPTTAGGEIFHGALVYYILAPIYFFSGNNPEIAAAIFRVINALGVFSVFYIGYLIFNTQVGILSSLLFAISFEQTQYSLFFGHPAPGVFTILIFYLGLALLIFKNESKGFVIALLGLGLSIQFEDANIPLILVFLIFTIIFNKKIKLLNIKFLFLGGVVLALTLSTFILSEIKYNFRMSYALLEIVSKSTNETLNIQNIFRLVPSVLVVFFIIVFFGMIRKKDLRTKGLFLSTWFLGGMIPQILNPNFTYYYSPGATVSLLILASFLIHQLFLKKKILASSIIGVIIFSNLSLVISQNNKGPNSDIVIQPGMLTVNQRQALDYIYEKASGQPFAVNALTVPLNIKTTWDYIFNWYGKEKYGYVPIWGGEAADGFHGRLEVITDRSKLPNRRFTVVEPTVGIGEGNVDDFFRIENYFSKVVEEKTFGTIKVQERERI